MASVPSGPLLNSQTGLLARTARFRWTNAEAYRSLRDAAPISFALRPDRKALRLPLVVISRHTPWLKMPKNFVRSVATSPKIFRCIL